MHRPVIGILLDYESKGSFSSRPHYALRTHYFEAIWKAGGSPVALPYIKSAVNSYISICDGLLFPGGFYPFPESIYSHSSKEIAINHPRFNFEKRLMKVALNKDLPILGICAGMQAIAALHGCKLYRNIIDESSSNFDHLNTAPAEKISHEITITDDTILSKILGVKKLKVNSAHSEGIKTTTADLIINAIAADGIIEGVELKNYQFCLGVQWHPEFFTNDDDPQFNLFKSLVDFSK